MYDLLIKRLQSDPGNEVLAISNTLDFFNIQNIVANVPKESFTNLPECFIARLENNGKSAIVLVTKLADNNVEVDFGQNKKQILTTEEFLFEWSGLIIAIDKKAKSKWALDQRNIPYYLGGLISLSTLSYVALNSESIFQVVFGTLSILGLWLSIIIVKEKYNPLNISSKYCKLGNNTSCQEVINSSSSKLFGRLDLGALSIIYFSTYVITAIANPTNSIIHLISVAAIPMVIYSIYSQLYLIKKWCPLCLGISAVLISQFAISIFHLSKVSLIGNEVALVCLIASIITLVWNSTEKLLQTSQEHFQLDLENLTFRRNHDLFLSYYKSLDKLPNLDTVRSIHLGNENSVVTITVITNPLCKSCKETYQFYKDLLINHPNEVSIKIFFLVPNKFREDPKTKISERLVGLYFNDGVEQFSLAMSDWYESLNVEKWLNKWGLAKNERPNRIITEQVEFCLKNGIESTPSILINNTKFPANYRIKDINGFIEPIIELEKKNTN